MLAPVLKTVRIFVASPADMKPERDCVKKVVLRLNESFAPKLGLALHFADWSSLARPAMARPEQVILDQLPVESWDIFIGLLWLRFGSPTGGSDPATGAQFNSGTHEEFKLAYQSWQSTKKPHIMFYRCVRPPTDIDGFDTLQLEQVRDFFKGFAHDKDHPGLHQMFREPDELESQVNTHLTDLLFALGSWGTPQLEIARKEPELALVPGQAYEVVAVSVDIVKHSEMVRRDKTEANHILEWFAECVFGIFARPQWAKINWTPDGGMFITTGEGRHDRAALAGIRLLMEITIRNLESSRLPLAIRLAAVDGQLTWNDNPSLISSETLNFAKHLEDGGTEAGEFCITDTLHLSVSDSVKSAFSHARRFQNRRILAYKSASATEPPTRDTIAKLVAQTTQLLNDLVARHSTPVLNESTQNATSDIDVVYSQLETFIRNFSAIDDRWSDAYIKQLNAWVTALLNGEKKYWEVISANYTRADEGSPEYEHWASVSAILGRRRTAAVLPLVRLKANTQVRIGKMRTTHSGTIPLPVLEKNIESITSFRVSAALEQTALDFVRADALQEEELFAEMMSRRDELITGITSPSAFGEFRDLLLNRLWTMSDLIIIDELQDLRAGLFATLMRDRSVRPRYAALMLTLRSSEPPTEEFVRSVFEKVGLSSTVQDLHAVWRSIVVGMSNRKKRVAALSHIPVEVLWRTIVSTNIRVSVLWTVAERFRRESDDVNKIFFDCVHARLVREVEVGGDELASVGRLISHFFQLPLFVQSPYFERLDDLLLNYKRVSSDMKLPADIFNNLAVKLRQVREDLGNPQASMPTGIEELPLPVQRHLASKGRYINSFVMHPNFRIASEIFPFITIANVESLITYRQFNEMLFQKVLQKKEFFTRQSTVVVALQHPKCTVEFARLNLLKIGEANLKKVAANVSANSAVREMAKRILTSRLRHAAGTTG